MKIRYVSAHRQKNGLSLILERKVIDRESIVLVTKYSKAKPTTSQERLKNNVLTQYVTSLLNSD